MRTRAALEVQEMFPPAASPSDDAIQTVPDRQRDIDVWAYLIEREQDPAVKRLMRERREIGLERYGEPLGGQLLDFRAEAIDEALDGMAYAQALGRRDAVWAFRDVLKLLLEPGEST